MRGTFMRGFNYTLFVLCLVGVGCGDFFEVPGTGGTGGGSGGTPGDPRFLADCSGGPLDAPVASCQPADGIATNRVCPIGITNEAAMYGYFLKSFKGFIAT